MKTEKNRSGCIDVFHAFMVDGATYDGDLEIPRLKTESEVPKKLVTFSKAISGSDYSAWVHFYEDDVAFARVWRNPKKYLRILEKYEGVIAPDFSLYRDMPLVMQEWNTYRSRAVAYWLQKNGLRVIPNIRWGDERTYAFCCCGIPEGGTIAIGSLGCIKSRIEREYFDKGLSFVVNKLKPKKIILYGSYPKSLSTKLSDYGIEIIHFDCATKVALCERG